MTKILALCAGNSYGRQMAKTFVKSFDPSLEAGTFPAKEARPKAVQVMKEVGLEISDRSPKLVKEFLDEKFITVRDDARQTCPAFLGKVAHRLRYGFVEPANAKGAMKRQPKTSEKSEI